ncbi:hypothetical protein [Collimonas sp. OK242]|jgi:hypothetical protein|nr:hypothetical protein [Collimonas sp. OK242]
MMIFGKKLALSAVLTVMEARKRTELTERAIQAALTGFSGTCNGA